MTEQTQPLHQQIRARALSMATNGRDYTARTAPAVIAILELHKPVSDGSGVVWVCGTCCGPSESWERLAVPYPCPTVRTLAKAFDVAVHDA